MRHAASGYMRLCVSAVSWPSLAGILRMRGLCGCLPCADVSRLTLQLLMPNHLTALSARALTSSSRCDVQAHNAAVAHKQTLMDRQTSLATAETELSALQNHLSELAAAVSDAESRRSKLEQELIASQHRIDKAQARKEEVGLMALRSWSQCMSLAQALVG